MRSALATVWALAFLIGAVFILEWLASSGTSLAVLYPFAFFGLLAAGIAGAAWINPRKQSEKSLSEVVARHMSAEQFFWDVEEATPSPRFDIQVEDSPVLVMDIGGVIGAWHSTANEVESLTRQIARLQEHLELINATVITTTVRGKNLNILGDKDLALSELLTSAPIPTLLSPKPSISKVGNLQLLQKTPEGRYAYQ